MDFNEWLLTVAEALSEGQTDLLEEMGRASRGWLQSERDLEAQQALITAALEAVEARQ
jgi:hypothetical protein